MALFYELLLKVARQETLTPLELEEFRQEAKSLNDVKTQVAAWFKGTGTPTLYSPSIYNPDFRTSPLHTFMVSFTTDVAVTNNTWTPILFDSSRGATDVFDFYQNDLTKVRVDRSQFSFTVDGFVAWEPNTTGDRVIRLRFFNSSGTQLTSQEINNGPTSNSASFALKHSFSVTFDVKVDFPNIAYMIVEVYQNSGISLNLEGGLIGVKIA